MRELAVVFASGAATGVPGLMRKHIPTFLKH